MCIIIPRVLLDCMINAYYLLMDDFSNLSNELYGYVSGYGNQSTYLTIIGLLILSIILMLIGIIWRTAKRISLRSLKLKQCQAQLEEEIIKRQKIEEKFKAIFNQTIQFIGLLDLEGNLLEVNQTALDCLGVKAEDVIGKPFWETPWWNYSSKYKNKLQAAIKEAKKDNIIRFETTHLVENHQKIYLDFSIKPVKDEKGKIIFLLPEARDITNIKKVEKELRDNQQELNAIFSVLPDLFFKLKADSTIIDYRKSTESSLYVPPKIFLKKPLIEILPDPVNKKVEKAINQALKLNTLVSVEYSLPMPTEEEYYEARLIPYKKDQIIAIVRNVTQEKKAESELIKSNNILKAITIAQSQFIADTLPHILFDDLLENLLSLTESEYGFIGEIGYNEQGEYYLEETHMKLRGKPYLKTHALTNISWNEETSNFYDENAPHAMEFHNLNTLFRAVITTGKPVIFNHSNNDPKRGDLTEDEPSLNAFLGLPFYHNNQLVGMVGVANRLQGYDDNLVEYLRPFLTTCANLIKAYRNEASRQQAEQEKEASENKLQALLTHSSDIVSIFNREGQLIYNSPAAEKIYGFSLEEMQQMRTFYLIHPDDRARVGKSFSQLLDYPRETITVQYRYQTKSNEYIWIETVASNQLDNPEIKGIVANSRDIKERKQVEEALRESEQKFRQLAENIHEVFWMTDISKSDPNDQKSVYVSPAYQEIWGYNPEDIYENASQWIEAIHPDDRERVKHEFAQKLLKGGFDFQYRIIRPDGTLRWIRDRGFPVKSQSGDLVRITGLAQDITEQKEREQEIKRLNEQLEERVSQRTAELEMLLNTLPDFVFVVERETMKLLFCNQVFAKGIGFEHRKQVQGKTIFDCFCPEMADYFVQQNQQVFDTGKTLHLEEIITLPDGEHFFDTYKVPLKNSHGEVYALLGTSRDVTELVKTKQVLMERTTQLEATNQELDSFCYSVSHDLRAPLRHIHGFVNALKPRLLKSDAKDDPKVIHYLDVIEKSSQKMGYLIDGLLTLSRVGRRELMFHEVNLNAVVKVAIDLVSSEAIDIEFKIGKLPPVLGDSALLQQVFINLINNSIKFSRGRNPIQIEINCLEDGTFFVADNGVGFDMKYADQLFGAFQRLHSQKDFEGTGIGLSIVQRIIHRHNGRIWAQSVVGEGATFYFKLN